MIFLTTLFDDGKNRLTIHYKNKEQITKRGNVIILASKVKDNQELKRWNACLKVNADSGTDFDTVFARAYKFIHELGGMEDGTRRINKGNTRENKERKTS